MSRGDAPGGSGSPNDAEQRRDSGPTLLDLVALVAGYGIAALAARTLWPAGVTPTGPAIAALLFAYGWLGLAMSGPFILLRRSGSTTSWSRDERGRPRRARIGQPLRIDPEPTPCRTRAETAWLLIGSYWIVAAFLVLPTRMPSGSAPMLGLLPAVMAIGLWMVGPSRRGADVRQAGWTHQTAQGVLITWPLAWLAVILLTLSFG